MTLESGGVSQADISSPVCGSADLNRRVVFVAVAINSVGAVPVGAPAVEISGFDSAGVNVAIACAVAYGDCGPLGGATDLLRRIIGIIVSYANTAVIVVTPAIKFPSCDAASGL